MTSKFNVTDFITLKIANNLYKADGIALAVTDGTNVQMDIEKSPAAATE